MDGLDAHDAFSAASTAAKPLAVPVGSPDPMHRGKGAATARAAVAGVGIVGAPPPGPDGFFTPAQAIGHVSFRNADGTDMLRKGKGVDNPFILKALCSLFTLGCAPCCATKVLGPHQYVIVKNIRGETGVLGAGEKGDIFAWKLLLSDPEVRAIGDSEPVVRGPLKIVPVPAGHYRMAFNVVTRKPMFLRAGLHVIDDPEIALVPGKRPTPVVKQHITSGTSHIVRVMDGEILCYRLQNEAAMLEGPCVIELDDPTFEFGGIYSCNEHYIHINDIHRFAIPEGRLGAVIVDGHGRFISDADRTIFRARELLLVGPAKWIYSVDDERIRAGNRVRIKVQATMVGIAVDGDGTLRILPTGVHYFDDPDFRFYGAISSEQHPIKIKGLRETAGDSGEATFDVTFAYRIDISDVEAVKRVYNNLGRNSDEVADKVKSMVVQKALSAFGHCDLGNRQEGLEARGVASVASKKAGAGGAATAAGGSYVPATMDADHVPPPDSSVKDIIVGELMGDAEGSLKEVLCNKFGILLDYVGIEQIQMPVELAREMQKQAIATAAGRANVLEAEADAAAAKARAAGDRDVLEIRASTDKSLAELRAKAKLIGARAEAEAIREVGAAKKEALSGLSDEAVRVMIAREAGEAIRDGHATLVGQGIDGIAAMMGASGKVAGGKSTIVAGAAAGAAVATAGAGRRA